MKKKKTPFAFAALLVLALALLFTAQAHARQAKPFTLIVLPDTQCYADTRIGFAARKWGSDLRQNFFDQTQWIKDNKDVLNIAMVAHVGDIVQADYEDEWLIADKAFATIDGIVPYVLCLGNHDFGFLENPDTSPKSWFAANRGTVNANKYFGPSRFEALPWYGDYFGQGNENSYSTFEAAGMKFLIIALELHPRDNTLVWANDVVAQHPGHRCIVLTHSYLNARNQRLVKDPYCDIEGNAGEAMWQKFVARHENIFLVLCGHMLGEGRLTSIGQKGNKVHQVLANYEFENNGGDGCLRIMTFIPDKDSIEVETYSPVLMKSRTSSKSQFSLEYEMND